MELNINEPDDKKFKKRVTFEYENEDESNVEDVGYYDVDSKFVPNTSPNVGKFQTIKNAKQPDPKNNVRINAPMDASIVNQKVATQPISVKKKKLSYDDILNSMNMRLGSDGKLQIYSQKLNEHQNQKKGEFAPAARQNSAAPTQYFQNNAVEQPPLTKKQYQQIVALELLRRQQEIKRVNEIKSTKLLFSNAGNRISATPKNGVNLNHLFRFK